jgi:hypothetical protein
MDSDIQDTHASYIDMRPVQFFDNYGKRLPEVRAAPELQPNHHLAPTPPDKMPASRFRYSPNARPRPCRDACSASAPHSAPPHRSRLHVQAGTNLAPTPPDKMPASRFRYSPNARPRPCRDACLARAPHSAPPHSTERPARTGRYWPCTHAPRYDARIRYSPNARPRPCRDACLAGAPHSAPPHRSRLHVQAGTGLAPHVRHGASSVGPPGVLATLLHLLAWPHPPHTLPSIHR